MEPSGTEQARLHAIYFCTILALLTLVFYLYLKSPSTPPLKGFIKGTTVQAKTPRQEASREVTTYRIRGIPSNWDKGRLETYLEDNGVKLGVKSLALEIRGDTKTGTCTFRGPRPAKPPEIPSKSPEFPLLAFDQDFYGMTTLYAPSPEDHKVDVVAMSGLGGHAFGSFKAKGLDYMWLRDALPHNLVSQETKSPMARIMTYGYESKLVNSDNFQSLSTLATDFSHHLLSLVEASTTKPIIIIAHSLGGLIVKQAMIKLSRAKGEDEVKLYRAVYGIVFFGVPHDGMKIEHLIPMVGDGPNRFLVESISGVNSMISEEASENFPAGLGGEGDSEVFCFYETKLSPIPEQTPNGNWQMSNEPVAVLVTKSSATRYCSRWGNGLEHECAIARDHSNIVKFKPHDEEYEKVLGKIHGIAKRARVRRPMVDNLSEMLAFEQMSSKYEGLKEHRAPETCQWLLGSKEFVSWKAEPTAQEGGMPRILLLAGKPGCGKSVLMRTAMEYSMNHNQLSDHIVLGFFFDARPNRGPLQKSGAGFYRSILYQLLRRLGSLEVEALLKLEESLPESISHDMSCPVLKKAISQTLSHIQPKGITIYVDGIDECTEGAYDDRSDPIGVLEFLTSLQSTGADVKICLSARTPASFGDHLQPADTVWVDRRNQEDIRTVLRGKLTGKEMLKRPELRRKLLHRVYARASNVFLWVDLVVAKLERKISDGKRDQYMLDLVDAMPEELPPLYRSLLSHVDAYDREKIQAEARVLFPLVQVAARPLTVVEVNSLLGFAIEDDSGQSGGGDDRTVAQIEDHIRFISCGLIECRPNTTRSAQNDQSPSPPVVQFIHKSVGDFIIEEQDPLIFNQTTPAGIQPLFHLNISKICTRVIQWTLDSMEDGEPPIFPYAAQFWMLHARKGETAMVDESMDGYAEFVAQCGDESAQAARAYKESHERDMAANWMLDVSDVPNTLFVHQETSLLELLAFEGCTRLVARHVRDSSGCHCAAPGTPTLTTQTLERAVFLAALRGYAETVRCVLDLAAELDLEINVDALYEGQETAMTSACFRGHLDVVQLLLEKGADVVVQAQQTSFSLPLQVAVFQGYLDVVKAILQYERESLDEVLSWHDAAGLTAIHTAVEYCRPEILKFMLWFAATKAKIDVVPVLQIKSGNGKKAYEIAVEKKKDAAVGSVAADKFERMLKEIEKYLPVDQV